MARGFSLLELLIATAVIGALVGLLIPALGLVRSQALATRCQSNERQMMAGVLAYQGDNKGYVPAVDWVSGCDWLPPGIPAPAAGVALPASPLFTFVDGGGEVPPIPAYLSGLTNSQDSSRPIDLMVRLPVAICPAMQVVFQTQDPAVNFPGTTNLKNMRPCYVSSRYGAPNIRPGDCGNGSLDLAMKKAGYQRLSDVLQPAKCGFIFCGNFRLDNLGATLPTDATANPTTIMPIHARRKLPRYQVVGSYQGAFDPTVADHYLGRVNVAYLDGRVAALGYAPGSSMQSMGGGDALLPAASPNTAGSAVSLFLKGGN